MLTGSSRVDPFTGRDQPGTYTCCTARYVSKPFKLKANGITTKRTNVKVYDVRDKRPEHPDPLVGRAGAELRRGGRCR